MKKIISSLALITFLIIACKKTELTVQPNQEIATVSPSTKAPSKTLTVTTTSVYVGSAIQVTPHGNVSYSGGGNSIPERGFCYSLTANPTISSDTIRAGSGVGDFSAFIQGLTPGTTYYIKAYAIKSGVVYYGNQLSFTTLTIGLPGPGIGIVYDIDNNAYNTITLGTQIWMVENLKTTHYRDGTSLPNITDNTAWANATSGAYCDYANNPSNSADYGRLYNLYAIKDSRNLAPAGWHIPNYTEWMTAINYLGGGGIAGGRMKEAGFTHWDSPNTGADNSSWLTALGSGFRSLGSSASFFGLKTQANFWSSSSNLTNPTIPSINAFILHYDSNDWTMQLGSIGGGSTYGYAVRCVKD